MGIRKNLEIERLRRNVRVQCVRPDAEREIPLELRRHATEHHAPSLLRAVAELAASAGDGKLVWIGLIEAGGIPAWYQSECDTLVAEGFEAAGTTCWKLHADACVRQ